MSETSFASRLGKAMSESGLKQVDLVRMASEQGVKLGKSQVSQYLSGKTVPRAGIMAFLASALGVSEDWLSGTGPEHAPATVNVTTKPTRERGTTMRTFNKSTKLDNVLYDVRGPVVDEANRMEEDGTHILKLNIGNPAPFGFRTPDEVVYDMRNQLTDCEGYSASKGLFSARKAIMQYDQIKGIPDVGMNDIYTGNGVSELINLCMSALLDNGDEILIPSPDYPL